MRSHETQVVEWKSSWRDECLKWVCRFANAQGGILEIGKDDGGVIVGVGLGMARERALHSAFLGVSGLKAVLPIRLRKTREQALGLAHPLGPCVER